mgnify:CR=1 FL=1
MKRKDVEDYLTPQEQAWLRHYRTLLNEARKAVQHEQARLVPVAAFVLFAAKVGGWW